MFGYRNKLKRDLAQWQEKGWVEANNAKAILKDIDARGSGLGLASILAILAAALLSFAAMSFVAANWQDMSKLGRLGLLFTALGGTYVCAWMFKERGMEFFSEAAILLGCGLFGANIMLIAQMYHMEGNPPDAVLLWALGTVLASLLLRSGSAAALSVMLFTLWSTWEGQLTHEFHWPYLVVWTGLLGWAMRLGWRSVFHFLIIALIIWAIIQIYNIRQPNEVQIITAIGLGIAALAFFAKDWIDKYFNFSGPLMSYGLVTAFLGVHVWQFIHRTELTELLMLAIATLAMIVAIIFYASRKGGNILLWLGYIGFSIEILSLYFKTLGTLLDTSLFFLIAGLIVSGLAYFAWVLHRGQTGTGEISK